jgi:hypothetical protein
MFNCSLEFVRKYNLPVQYLSHLPDQSYNFNNRGPTYCSYSYVVKVYHTVRFHCFRPKGRRIGKHQYNVVDLCNDDDDDDDDDDDNNNNNNNSNMTN